jgi:hypothetical protein
LAYIAHLLNLHFRLANHFFPHLAYFRGQHDAQQSVTAQPGLLCHAQQGSDMLLEAAKIYSLSEDAGCRLGRDWLQRLSAVRIRWRHGQSTSTYRMLVHDAVIMTVTSVCAKRIRKIPAAAR